MSKHCSACTCLLNFTESLQCCNKRPQRVSPNSCGASDTHTHKNRMQSIGLFVGIKASNICKHTIHCVTVATNGTFYCILDCELSDNFWEHHSASSAFAVVNACQTKNSSSISIVGVSHVPFRSKRNHEITYSFTRYHSAKRQIILHNARNASQASQSCGKAQISKSLLAAWRMKDWTVSLIECTQ